MRTIYLKSFKIEVYAEWPSQMRGSSWLDWEHEASMFQLWAGAFYLCAGVERVSNVD